MKLKTIYDTAEEIPEGYEGLYTERNGKFELTAIEGVRTQADVDRVQSALTKERADHKAAKTALQAFEGIDAATVTESLNELETVKAQLDAINKDGRVDEAKLEPIIAARVKQAVAPLERDKGLLERKLNDSQKLVAEKDVEVGTLKSTMVAGGIERAIRDAAAEAKVLSVAISDAVLNGQRYFEQTEDGRIITKDVFGVTPGLSPKEWLKDMQDKAPHWWPASVGGGSKGGGVGGGRGKNPWAKENWNLTEQGKVVRELGATKAQAMAEAAGSTLGATKPAAA